MMSAARYRTIIQFEQAMYRDSTPYTQLDFSSCVKIACENPDSLAASRQYSSKVVILGNPDVDKTALIIRFCHDTFARDYKATIGVDFEVEKFTVLSVPFSLQLWDTAGAERFKCIAASYYRGASVIVIVFDMSNINTLKSVRQWRDEACSYAQTDEQQLIVFIVGNKFDQLCESELKEVEQQGLAVASELKAEFWVLSTVSGANVEEFFRRVVTLSFDRMVLRSLHQLRDKPGPLGDTEDKRITLRRSTEEKDECKRMKAKKKC